MRRACRAAKAEAPCQEAAVSCIKDPECAAWLASKNGLDAASTRAGRAPRDLDLGGGGKVAHEAQKLAALPATGMLSEKGYLASSFARMPEDPRRRLESYLDAHCIQAPADKAVCDPIQACVEVGIFELCRDSCRTSSRCALGFPAVPPPTLAERTAAPTVGAPPGAEESSDDEEPGPPSGPASAPSPAPGTQTAGPAAAGSPPAVPAPTPAPPPAPPPTWADIICTDLAMPGPLCAGPGPDGHKILYNPDYTSVNEDGNKLVDPWPPK
ncbi:MAG: hypothetical protein HY554_16905 [Elusimicrobia bacterium]|nr:hypothetical protein [Elusimicrobiota bacterium]